MLYWELEVWLAWLNISRILASDFTVTIQYVDFIKNQLRHKEAYQFLISISANSGEKFWLCFRVCELVYILQVKDLIYVLTDS